MRKLVMLSDIQQHLDAQLCARVNDMLYETERKLGYIPSRSDKERKYYKRNQTCFKQMGFKDFLYFDLDEEYDSTLTEDLLRSDAIFLSGGNTYYFLNNIKKRDFLTNLRDYVEKGGILIGMSAGSIIMSEHIGIAQLLDENAIQLKELEALQLVDFEFMPHWNQMEGDISTVLTYSNNNNGKMIYTCNDGDGLIVINDDVHCFGNIRTIQNGNSKKTHLA